jgi:hypothetical protein
MEQSHTPCSRWGLLATRHNSISMEVPEAGLDVPQGQTHKRQRLMEVPERASLELVSNVELHSEEHPRGVSGF